MMSAILVLVVSLVDLVDASAFQAPKVSRPAAQQKINSQLRVEIELAKSGTTARQKSSERGIVQIDQKRRALVDVRTAVTPAMTKQLVAIGGTLVFSWAEAESITAWVPLLQLERLAESPSIRAIEPAALALTNGSPANAKP